MEVGADSVLLGGFSPHDVYAISRFCASLRVIYPVRIANEHPPQQVPYGGEQYRPKGLVFRVSSQNSVGLFQPTIHSIVIATEEPLQIFRKNPTVMPFFIKNITIIVPEMGQRHCRRGNIDTDAVLRYKEADVGRFLQKAVLGVGQGRE